MKTLKNIKVGDILTDEFNDDMNVEEIVRVNGKAHFIVSYEDESDAITVWNIHELKQCEYWIKEEESSSDEEGCEECDCYDEGYNDGCHDQEYKYLASREMREHYKELFEVASNEHTFANLQIELMLSVLEEIKEVTDEEVVKMIIDNALERRDIDIAIHCKQLAS